MERKRQMDLLFALVIFISLALACDGVDPPKWPKKYMVQGTLSLPYAEINEPFTAYMNSGAGLSRIDFWGDLDKTLQVAGQKKGDYGKGYKIVPMTTEEVYNKQSCFLVNGTKDGPVSTQSVLPDLTNFQAISSDMLGGRNCTMWQNITKVGMKKNTYTMWVENVTNKPVRYEMIGYNTLLGSHYDKYYLEYTDFDTNFTDKVFDIVKNMSCGGFPGPGAEHRILMNPMAEFIDNNDRHIHEMFEDFKHRHRKDYPNEKEETLRKVNFMNNVRFIQSKNRAGLTYRLAVNHLADLTDEERKAMRGRKRSSQGYNGGEPFTYPAGLKGLPEQWDWRLVGAVTQVKDQAVCGSCWSFGTAGVIEGAYFIKTGKLVRLSQQELMDCSWGEGNNACDGGEDFRAYQWIMKHGLATEDDYGEYLANDGSCHYKKTPPTVHLSSYVNVTSGDLQALKVAIATKGPISVGIDASHKSLSFYANGVYYEPECGNKPDDLDHAVLAVGYGVIQGQPYWLIKNSWSTYWGNNGYVLMSQRNNNCGVATDATFPIIA